MSLKFKRARVRIVPVAVALGLVASLGVQSQAALPAFPQGAQVTTFDGFTRVESATAWSLTWKQAEFDAWSYGQNDSPTFHLEAFPYPEEPARGRIGGFTMYAPYAWVVKWDSKTKTGLWLSAEKGSRVAVSQTGTGPRGDAVKISMPANSAVVFAELKGAVMEGFKLALAAQRPIQWNGLTGTWGDVTIQAEDRNGDGKPDQTADRWNLLAGGKRKLVYSFYTKDQDPKKEGAFCLIATDLNKDGVVDDAEAAKPTYKLVDLNGDGQFFAGHILQGGRLEQDEYYYNLEGAEGGTLWTHRVRALDLDGDGDQDVNERINFLDYYPDRGIGGAGTAADKEGILMDYSDRPMSEVLEINAATGAIRQHKIRYDQYFFSDNTCASAATYIDRDRLWYLMEEHMEYEGFHPGYGEAHLWTFDGVMHRIIYGELGGFGKWKLGVDFGSYVDKLLPDKKVTWRTPWGQDLKTVSYLEPKDWKGEKLPYVQKPGEHLDYAHPSPFSWAFKQTVDSITTIEPNDPAVPGQQAYEAYLGGTVDGSRQEYSPYGKTTFVFYHSPLMNGLQHRDALRGNTLDQKLFYFDRDEDGAMDAYAFDAAGDGRYTRRLWYDRKAGRVTLFDDGKLYAWPLQAEFPETHIGLENFGRLDQLYRMGDKDNALVKQPVPADAKPVASTPLTVAVDVFHGGEKQVGWNAKENEGGSAGIARVLALTPADLTAVTAPFSADTLAPIRILVLSYIQKPLTAQEQNALAAWVKAGGTLILAPAGANTGVPGEFDLAADQVAAFQSLARGFQTDFSDERINLDFKRMRIPDQGNIEGDVIGEKTPTADNRVSRFTGKKEWLAGLSYLAAQGLAVKAPETLLAHGDRALIGRSAAGKGQVFVVGGALLANRFCRPPLHGYIIRGGEEHVDNRYLAERFFDDLTGAPYLPHPARFDDLMAKPEVKPAAWRTESMESDVLKLSIYPELGGRVWWLGRKDTGLNHMRVEAPDYMAGQPLDNGPFHYGRNYGGVWDIGAPDWPGFHFFFTEYQVQTLSMPHAEDMTVKGEAEGIEVTRQMLLTRKQSLATFNVSEKNVSPYPRRMMVRLQTEFQAGPDGVDVYWPSPEAGNQMTQPVGLGNPTAIPMSGGKIKKVNYILGKEEGRGMLPFKGNWAASVDKASREAIVHRINPDLNPQLFYWSAGYGRENENWSSKEYPTNYYGFYGLQFWHKAQIVPPGESISAPVRMDFLVGLDAIDAVGPDYAAELNLSSAVIVAGETLTVKPRVASAGTTPVMGAKVSVAGPQGFQVMAKEFDPVVAEAPGRAREWTWTLDTANWPDGEYAVTMTCPDGQTATRSFQVATAEARAAEAKIAETAKVAAAAPAGMAQSMAQALVARAQASLKAHDFKQADRDVERARALTGAP